MNRKKVLVLWVAAMLALVPIAALGAQRTLLADQGDVSYFVENGKLGLVGIAGIVMVGPTMDEVTPFYDGVAGAREGALWGLIGKHGWIRQPFSTIPVNFFSGDEAYALYSPEKGRYGFVDRKGNTVVEPGAYQDAGPLCEGLFPAKTAQGWGYVGTDGDVKIGFAYDAALPFGEGLAPVQKDGKWGYVNPQGETVLPFQYEEAGVFVKGLAPVRQPGESASVYINSTGEVALTGKWDVGYAFSADGLAIVKVADKYGYINRKGKFAVAAKFWEATDFDKGYAIVRTGESDWRIIDKKGKIVSKRYLTAGSFHKGFVHVSYETDSKKEPVVSGYVNYNGHLVCKDLGLDPFLAPKEEP